MRQACIIVIYFCSLCIVCCEHIPTPQPSSSLFIKIPVQKKTHPTPETTVEFFAPTTPAPKRSPTPEPTVEFFAPTTPAPKRSPTPEPTADFFIEIPTPKQGIPSPVLKHSPTPEPTAAFVVIPADPTPAPLLRTQTPQPSRQPTGLLPVPEPIPETSAPTLHAHTYSPVSRKRPTPSPILPPTALDTTPEPTMNKDAVQSGTTAPSASIENTNMNSSGAIEGTTYIFYSVVLMMVVVGTCAYFYRNFKAAVRSAFHYSPVSSHDGDIEYYSSSVAGYARPSGTSAPSAREIDLARFNRMAGGGNTYPLPNSSASQSGIGRSW